MLLELNKSETKECVLRYYRQAEYSEPPSEISLLFTRESPISTIYYLYEELSNNSSIKNRRKRLILVDTFYQLIQNSLPVLIGQFAETGVTSDLVSNILMKVVNVPSIIINFDPSRNLIAETYRWLVSRMEEFSQSVRLSLINRLTTLGQVQILFETESSSVIQTVKSKFSLIPLNYRILTHLAISKFPLFQQLMSSLEPKVKIRIIQKLLFSTQLPPSYASVLDLLPLPKQSEESLLQSLMVCWSESTFLDQTPYTQKLITNYIVLKIKRMTVQYLSEALPILNKGITSRFEYSKTFQFVRESGLIVWKAYVRGMGFQESIESPIIQLTKGQLFLDDVQPQSNPVKATIVSDSGEVKNIYIPRPKEQPQHKDQSVLEMTPTGQQQYTFQPKNLLDCYLGILSQNNDRKEVCLKSISRLVRSGESDIAFTFQKLLNALLFLHDSNNSIKSFEESRISAVTSLIIHQPIEAIGVITGRFYNKECSVADKIMILNSLNHAVEELSNNPKKYQVESKEKSKQFYFQRVTSKYYNQQDSKRREKEVERQTKLEDKSKRWGNTRIEHQKVKLSLSSSSLVPIRSSELLLHDPFINRFYSLVDQIFFTFVYKIPSLGYLLKDLSFLSSLFGMLNTFLDNLNNYHNKYRIAEEVVDILNQITESNPQIQKGRIGVLLKVVGMLDANVHLHQLLLVNIHQLLKQFEQYQRKIVDPSIKIIYTIIQERLNLLLDSHYNKPKPSPSNILFVSQL